MISAKKLSACVKAAGILQRESYGALASGEEEQARLKRMRHDSMAGSDELHSWRDGRGERF